MVAVIARDLPYYEAVYFINLQFVHQRKVLSYV